MPLIDRLRKLRKGANESTQTYHAAVYSADHSDTPTTIRFPSVDGVTSAERSNWVNGNRQLVGLGRVAALLRGLWLVLLLAGVCPKYFAANFRY